jgi:hypothetical protein
VRLPPQGYHRTAITHWRPWKAALHGSEEHPSTQNGYNAGQPVGKPFPGTQLKRLKAMETRSWCASTRRGRVWLTLQSCITIVCMSFTGSLSGQDAGPSDRNDVNTAKRPGDMMADSPVTFPKRGALPSEHPPDVRVKSEPTEKDYFIFGSPCRSLAQIDEIQAKMPKGHFTPPKPDWSHLSRTQRILTGGGELRIVAVGDSIVNDTMRSGWIAKLAEAYPKATIHATVYVRGGGGCQHYKEENRLNKNVIPRKPHLVFIGGISQKSVDDIRQVIDELQAALPNVEILLTSGTFGTTDPRNSELLTKARHSGMGEYGQSLQRLAEEEGCAYLDMTTPWAEYIRSSGLHPHRFYRDPVHANEYGEQILSKILIAFFAPSSD